MGRKKKDPTTSIPQEATPLVDSTNKEIESISQTDNVDEVQINADVDKTETVEEVNVNKSVPIETEPVIDQVDDNSSNENGEEIESNISENVEAINPESNESEKMEDDEAAAIDVDVAPEIDILNGNPILDIDSKDSDSEKSQTNPIQEGDNESSQDTNNSEIDQLNLSDNNAEKSSSEGESNDSDSIPVEKPNVIVLRAFDLGDVHYSPLKKCLIPDEHIPELLESKKIKLICKHG